MPAASRAFDLLDRVTNNAVVPAPGVMGTTNETYTYDGLSRNVDANNGDYSLTTHYDSLSHPILQTHAGGVGGLVGYINFTMKYDSLGNLTEMGYPAFKTLVQTYDALNRLKVSRFNPPGPGSTNAIYQYVGSARVARIDYGNGTKMDVAYDGGVARVQQIQHSAAGIPFFGRQFAWDASRDMESNSNLFGADYRTYRYDSLDRLVQSDDSTVGSPTIYGLDAAGNRTNVNQGPGAGSYTSDATLPEPADFQVNQYTTGPSNTARAYDANGNLTNIRSAGADEKLEYPPPLKMSVEECLEFLADDELLEVTPKSLRLRKKMLTQHDRLRTVWAGGSHKDLQIQGLLQVLQEFGAGGRRRGIPAELPHEFRQVEFVAETQRVDQHSAV